MSKQDINVDLTYTIDYIGFEKLVPEKRMDQFALEALAEVQAKRDIIKFKVIASIMNKVTDYLNESR